MNYKTLDVSTTRVSTTSTLIMDSVVMDTGKPLIINQTLHTVPSEWSLQQLVDIYLSSLAGCSGPFAVIHNQRFVPKSEWASCELTEGDHIETLSPVQGG